MPESQDLLNRGRPLVFRFEGVSFGSRIVPMADDALHE